MKNTKVILKEIHIDELDAIIQLDVANEFVSLTVKRDGVTILNLKDQTPREIDNLLQVIDETFYEVNTLEKIKKEEEK